MPADNHQPFYMPENKIYPVFQLWAKNTNKKLACTDIFKISILKLMSWMRTKYKSDIPNEFCYPTPDEYEKFDLASLRSFQLEQSYVVTAVYLPDEQSFSFQIIEDDRGSDEKAAVPGRKFITNIGMCINDGNVEYGFKVLVSEPGDNTENLIYYRMKLIKLLANDERIGLTMHYNIQTNVHLIKNQNDVDFLVGYLDNRLAHLPVLVFSQYQTQQHHSTESNLDDLHQKILGGRMQPVSMPDIKISLPQMTVKIKGYSDKPKKDDKSAKNKLSIKDSISKSEPAVAYAYSYDYEPLINKMLGFAHIVLLPYEKIETFNKKFGKKITPGDAAIFYPKSTDKKPVVYAKEQMIKICGDEKAGRAFLSDIYQSARTVRIGYGKVLFVSEARSRQYANALNEKKNSDREKGEIIEHYENILSSHETHYTEMLKELRGSNDILAKKLNQSELRCEKLKKEKLAWEEKLRQLESKLKASEDKYRSFVDYSKKKKNRPRTVAGIADWVKNTFDGRLILHDNAKKMLSDGQKYKDRVDLICDGLEYLADLHYDVYFHKAGKDDIAGISSDRYDRDFEVSPINALTIKTFPKQYKVKYKKEGETKSHEVGLNFHLSCGNKHNFLVRIYFFCDDERQLIVVGSLPEHLDSLKIDSN